MMRYHVTLELCFHKYFPTMLLEVMSEVTLAVIIFDWSNDVLDLSHNAFATSVSSNKSRFVV